MPEEKVPNRFGAMTPEQAEAVAKYNKRGWSKVYTEDGTTYRIKVKARFDDECKNGHATFSLTADVDRKGKNGHWYEDSGGCLHEEIEKRFPHLAKYIRWHLTSTDGPLHYAANAVFLAGDRDCWKHRKGEACAWSYAVQFGANPIKHRIGKRFAEFLQESAKLAPQHGRFDFEVLRYEHDPDPKGYKFSPKYTFGGFADKWHECPFDTEPEALDFLLALRVCSPHILEIPTAWSEGKARELDAARRAAVWPDATDDELSVEPDELRAKLAARLSALLADFRAAMEELGFTWPEEGSSDA